MICPNLADGICGIATAMSGQPVLPILSQCEYCTYQAEPAQSVNRVTVSLAIKNGIDSATRADVFRKYAHLLQVAPPAPVIPEGPGTELKKLISWFYVPDDSSCKCNDRIAKMNKWGPDGCEERMDTIVRWLKHSAATHNAPFQETVVRMLIKRAISNARKAV